MTATQTYDSSINKNYNSTNFIILTFNIYIINMVYILTLKSFVALWLCFLSMLFYYFSNFFPELIKSQTCLFIFLS